MTTKSNVPCVCGQDDAKCIPDTVGWFPARVLEVNESSRKCPECNWTSDSIKNMPSNAMSPGKNKCPLFCDKPTACTYNVELLPVDPDSNWEYHHVLHFGLKKVPLKKLRVKIRKNDNSMLIENVPEWELRSRHVEDHHFEVGQHVKVISVAHPDHETDINEFQLREQGVITNWSVTHGKWHVKFPRGRRCPDCDGTVNANKDPSEGSEKDCKRCEGTGKLTKVHEQWWGSFLPEQLKLLTTSPPESPKDRRRLQEFTGCALINRLLREEARASGQPARF